MPLDPSIGARLAAVPAITATTQRDAPGAELDVVCQLAMDASRALVAEAGALGDRVTALEEGGGAGTVQSVNGVEPDGAGDVELTAADIGAADATATAAALSEIDGRLDALESSPGGGVSIYYRADDLDAGEDDDAMRLAENPYSGALQVFKNGALLRAVQAALTGRNIALSTPAVDGDWYSVRYWTEAEAPGASVMLRTMTLSGTLPAGALATAYSAALTRTGGAPPFAWSISAGALPAGLSIDVATGLITGTPTTGGSSSFTVRVESDDGQVQTSAQTVNVAADPFAADLVFLLQMDGADGSSAFPDETGRSWTAENGPTIQGNAGEFLSTNVGSENSPRISAADASALRFGTADFTIDGFFEPLAPHISVGFFYRKGQNTSDGLMLGVSPTTVWWRSNVFEDLSATVTVNAGDHVAFVREGAARRIYVAGSLVASDSAGGFNNSATESVYIGGVSGDGRFGYRGKIQALRGTLAARFSGSSFTPPGSFPNP